MASASVEQTGQESRRGRTSAALVAYLALFFCVWALRATALFFIDRRIQADSAKAVYSNAVKLAVWVVPVFVYLKFYDRRKPLEYLKLTTRPSGGGLLYAALAVALFFACVVLAEPFVSGRSLGAVFGSGHALPAIAAASTTASSLLEEIMFRGFVLRQLWERLSFLPANVLTAVLFVLVHWPNWLWTEGFRVGLLATSLSIFVLALLLGYLLKWTNSLWPCVAVHAANNLLSGFLHG